MTNKTCQCPHSPGWLRWFDHQELSSFYCQPSQDNASVILKLQKNPPITFFAPLFSLGPGWLRLLRALHPSESQWARSDFTSHMLCLERTAALQKTPVWPPADSEGWEKLTTIPHISGLHKCKLQWSRITSPAPKPETMKGWLLLKGERLYTGQWPHGYFK